MVTLSDDQAASRLWVDGGDGALVTRIVTRFGLAGVAPPANPSTPLPHERSFHKTTNYGQNVHDRLASPDVRTVSASHLEQTPAGPEGLLPILVLDFDGTVCLGDGPIWAYADALLPALDPDRASHVTAGLADFLAGRTEPDDFSDGYSAVVRLAGAGVSSAALSKAYLASRESLAAGEVDVHSPDGLSDLLAELAGTVRRVLLTNAPDIGMTALLDRLGLTETIDEVITSAGKPDGFARLLPELLDGNDPARLLSVGDMWVNDIAHPLHAGCATGYVDRTGADPRPAHVRATTLPGLYPAIRAWSADPHAFVEQHRPDVADPGAPIPSPRS